MGAQLPLGGNLTVAHFSLVDKTHLDGFDLALEDEVLLVGLCVVPDLLLLLFALLALALLLWSHTISKFKLFLRQTSGVLGFWGFGVDSRS